MKWWNADLAMLRAPILTDAAPAVFGAWVRVMAYACEQEDGGRLRGAMLWTERQWLVACNVTRADVNAADGLLVVDGDDLIVWGYPAEREAMERTRRSEGARGGRATTAAKARAARLNGQRGGRPKLHASAPIEEPNETQQEPNETQPPKPTGATFTYEERPENPREGKGSIREVCVADARTPRRITVMNQPPRHDDFVREGQTCETWLEGLRVRWPHVNLDHEMKEAEKYVQRKRGSEARLGMRFFEGVWLSRCEQGIVVPKTARNWARDDEMNEPKGWRDAVADSIYGAGQSNEVACWGALPLEAKKFAMKQLAEEGAVHA